MARSVARLTCRVNAVPVDMSLVRLPRKWCPLGDVRPTGKMGGITGAKPYFLAHRGSIFDH
jgi:hypothetical protein